MSQKEIMKLHVIKSCVDGYCTVRTAAETLRLSERRIKQLKKEYKLKGADALIHGNANKQSPNRMPAKTEEKILTIWNDPALDSCNFNHFKDILHDNHKLDIPYSTLYRMLSRNGIKSPKKRRKKREVHITRERKEAAGMMLQADGTPYQWFGGKEMYSLHGFIDDATGMITGLYLCKNECLLGYLEVLRQTLVNYGIPQSLYPDRYSVFFHNRKNELKLSIEEQLSGTKKKLTQFGRIVEYLGIDMFAAQSPQAKGRIERLWDTLQSRLPVEFAMAGIKDIDTANEFLESYLPKFNKRFAVEPKSTFSAFVPIPDTIDLDRLLCVRWERQLSSGSTISLMNKKFRIEQDKFPSKTKVSLLLSEKLGLKALINGKFYPITPIDNVTQSKEDLSFVITSLINESLLKDAKVA